MTTVTVTHSNGILLCFTHTPTPLKACPHKNGCCTNCLHKDFQGQGGECRYTNRRSTCAVKRNRGQAVRMFGSVSHTLKSCRQLCVVLERGLCPQLCNHA